MSDLDYIDQSPSRDWFRYLRPLVGVVGVIVVLGLILLTGNDDADTDTDWEPDASQTEASDTEVNRMPDFRQAWGCSRTDDSCFSLQARKVSTIIERSIYLDVVAQIATETEGEDVCRMVKGLLEYDGRTEVWNGNHTELMAVC